MVFKVRVTGGGPGHCLAEFVVRPDDLNADGGLNGGLTATIVSNFTTYALLASGSKPGTTADLHVRLERKVHEFAFKWFKVSFHCHIVCYSVI